MKRFDTPLDSGLTTYYPFHIVCHIGKKMDDDASVMEDWVSELQQRMIRSQNQSQNGLSVSERVRLLQTTNALATTYLAKKDAAGLEDNDIDVGIRQMRVDFKALLKDYRAGGPWGLCMVHWVLAGLGGP